MYLMNVMDCSSKWSGVDPISNVTVKTAAEALRENVIARQGESVELHSD